MLANHRLVINTLITLLLQKKQDVLVEIASGEGHTYAMHLKETEEGKYRDMDFGTGRAIAAIFVAIRTK